VERLTWERERVARTVGRWRSPGLKRGFEGWVEYVESQMLERGEAAQALARREFEDACTKSQALAEADAERRVRLLEEQRGDLVAEKAQLEQHISHERSKHLAELEMAWAETRSLKEQVDALQREVAANQIAALARAQAIVRKVQTDASTRLGEGAAALAARDEELELTKAQLLEAAVSASKLSDMSLALNEKEAEVSRLGKDLDSAEKAIEHATKALATLNSVQLDNEKLLTEVEDKSRALDEALASANELEHDIKTVQDEMAMLKAASLMKAQALTKQTQQIAAADLQRRQYLASQVDLKGRAVEKLQQQLSSLEEVLASETTSMADQISVLQLQSDLILRTLADAEAQALREGEVSLPCIFFIKTSTALSAWNFAAALD